MRYAYGKYGYYGRFIGQFHTVIYAYSCTRDYFMLFQLFPVDMTANLFIRGYPHKMVTELSVCLFRCDNSFKQSFFKNPLFAGPFRYSVSQSVRVTRHTQHAQKTETYQ